MAAGHERHAQHRQKIARSRTHPQSRAQAEAERQHSGVDHQGRVRLPGRGTEFVDGMNGEDVGVEGEVAEDP